ncbi:MAG TPA: alpha/beta hydrolase-fold protein [Bacteroidota bacterium]
MMKLFAVVILLGAASYAQKTDKPVKVSGVEIGEVFEIHSKQLNETRRYSVSLPTSYYQSQEEYPLLVVLDGEYYFVPAVGAMRFMSMNHMMPEVIVVGIHNTNRRRDMTPPDISLPDVPKGKAESFLAFLGEELLPVLQSRYRLLPLRVLVGHSHGALFGVYALSARPELFRWHLVVDPPVHLNDYTSERRLLTYFTAHPKHSGRMALFERTFGWSDQSWGVLEKSLPKSFSVKRMKMPEEKHPTMFFPALYEGLKWLFSDLMFRQDTLTTLSELKTRYTKLSAASGYDVPIPHSLLSLAAEEQLMAGKSQEASAFVEELKTRFGQSAETKSFDVWVNTLRKNPLEETYDQILRSPAPTPTQMKTFIGTWEGVGLSLSPNKVVISFEVREGKVVAEHREYDESGSEVTPILGNIAFLRMKGNDTIEWGYMNGIRPRTMVIAFAGKLDASGALVGLYGLKAVSFSPERTDNPSLRESFKFTRQQ